MNISNLRSMKLLGVILLCTLISSGCHQKISDPLPPQQVTIAEESTKEPQASSEPVKEETKKTSSTLKETTPVPSAMETTVPPSVTGETNSPAPDPVSTCTLSVNCATAVGKGIDQEVIIPENGVIYPEQTVTFQEGESVFDLLLREMKDNKIHLEFVSIPIYHSAYIEGIGNLYEYDCGELSGWMYQVNGTFPNYGSSQYKLKQGDKVVWVYTCDLGKDVGGDYAARNGRKSDE